MLELIIDDTTLSLKNIFVEKLGLPNTPKLNNNDIEIYCGITIL